jgi:hypothetical protein
MSGSLEPAARIQTNALTDSLGRQLKRCLTRITSKDVFAIIRSQPDRLYL